MDYLKSQTKELREEGAMASNEISKVKGADWATKIKGRGDFRFRQESIWPERVRQRRGRGRRRPSSPAHPRPPRLRLQGRPTTSRARCCLPRVATIRVRPTRRWAAAARASRSASTWPTSTGSSCRAATCCSASRSTRSSARARACSTTATTIRKAARSSSIAACSSAAPTAGGSRSNYNSNPAGENTDSAIFGLQGGMKFPLFGGETVLAANYYECGSCQGESPLFNNNAQRQHDVRCDGTTNRLHLRLRDPRDRRADRRDGDGPAADVLGQLRAEHGQRRRVRHGLRDRRDDRQGQQRQDLGSRACSTRRSTRTRCSPS